MLKNRKLLFSALLGIGTLAFSATSFAATITTSGESEHSAGTYVATALSNVVYFPVKVVFAGTGAATSGLTYVLTLGNEKLTRSIWDQSVSGDYLITPTMIEGRRNIRFAGP